MTKMGQKRTEPRKPMRRTPKPKKGKVSDATLDDLQRKFVRLISGGYCKRCKRWGYIEVAHMYRRRRKTVRWDLRNVYPLCLDCHHEVDEDPIKLTSFMYEVMSLEEVADLSELANKTVKEHPINREEIKEYYKEQMRRLEG